ncbi:MAG: phosphatidylserine decarboxylase [Planctomycetota bacterium]|jgi:phosphatidylserine decarboxylase
MRIPLTRYGWPQVAAFPAIILAAMVIGLPTGLILLPHAAVYLIEAVLAFVLIATLMFFRDPYRPIPSDKNILLAPADGRVTDIEISNENQSIGRPVLRIGIFLSILDVHINRAPCSARVEEITYRQGKYRNAMSPASGRVNESNDLALLRTDNPQDTLIVRQISGAIARRIVCATSQGQILSGGQQFGMIKFGSRTELHVPFRENVRCLARVGDKVKAGISPLVRYEGKPLCGNQLCPD